MRDDLNIHTRIRVSAWLYPKLVPSFERVIYFNLVMQSLEATRVTFAVNAEEKIIKLEG